jgi:hypothetical protein
MSVVDLNLSSVELTSTLRTAPLNGSPSSSDYNDGQRENLVDLATLADFINNVLLPLLNALPAGALLPTAIPVGIEGRTIWTDTSDQSNLFFNALSSQSLSIADTIRVLNGIVTVMNQQLIDQGVEVASLQARLASTNQNDISLALQNLTSALNQISVNQQIQNTTITQIQGNGVIVAQSGEVLVSAGTLSKITVPFAAPFNDNFYTVITGLEVMEGANGLVLTSGFQKNGVGVGITAGVVNYDAADHYVVLHVIAQGSSSSTSSTGGASQITDTSVQTVNSSTSIGLGGKLNTVVKATAGNAGITLTLPDATTIIGQIIRIIMMDVGDGGVNVVTTATQTINNFMSYLLSNQFQSITLESDGENWIIVASTS